MTVMEFLFQRRMERAAGLLVESTFSIRRVATACGYVSSAPFIKAFSRHFHLSPSEYRAQNKPDVRFD
jgi:transcriptional regulator GlxA family with amidase domain